MVMEEELAQRAVSAESGAQLVADQQRYLEEKKKVGGALCSILSMPGPTLDCMCYSSPAPLLSIMPSSTWPVHPYPDPQPDYVCISYLNPKVKPAQMMAEIADLTERNSHLLEQIDGLKAQVQSVTEPAAAGAAAAAAAAVLAADSIAELNVEVRGEIHNSQGVHAYIRC
jgi:hypothetical protein